MKTLKSKDPVEFRQEKKEAFRKITEAIRGLMSSSPDCPEEVASCRECEYSKECRITDEIWREVREFKGNITDKTEEYFKKLQQEKEKLQNPSVAYAHALKHGPCDETRRASFKTPYYTFWYAYHVDKGPRDDTRTAICQSPPAIVYRYANTIDKGFHPETWSAIQGSNWEEAYLENIGVPEEEEKEERKEILEILQVLNSNFFTAEYVPNESSHPSDPKTLQQTIRDFNNILEDHQESYDSLVISRVNGSKTFCIIGTRKETDEEVAKRVERKRKAEEGFQEITKRLSDQSPELLNPTTLDIC